MTRSKGRSASACYYRSRIVKCSGGLYVICIGIPMALMVGRTEQPGSTKCQSTQRPHIHQRAVRLFTVSEDDLHKLESEINHL
ncbi:hypothetical protein BJY01DRAFT_203726, partial [Aspergillus pseudoustus]